MLKSIGRQWDLLSIVVSSCLKVESNTESSLLSAHGEVRNVYNNFGIAREFHRTTTASWECNGARRSTAQWRSLTLLWSAKYTAGPLRTGGPNNVMSCGAIRLKSFKVSMLTTMSKSVAMISNVDALSVRPVSALTVSPSQHLQPRCWLLSITKNHQWNLDEEKSRDWLTLDVQHHRKPMNLRVVLLKPSPRPQLLIAKHQYRMRKMHTQSDRVLGSCPPLSLEQDLA